MNYLQNIEQVLTDRGALGNKNLAEARFSGHRIDRFLIIE